MPRSGSGIYSIPPGTDAVSNATIASTPYNGFTHDIESDLNAPRPIVAGGTGATNAHDALIALHGEEAQQGPVTNFDTFPFVSGSFYSNPSATGAPTTGSINGYCYVHNNPAYLTLEARDVFAATTRYVRHKTGGGWGAWVAGDQSIIDYANTKVAKTGDIMSGDLALSYADPAITLSKSAGATGHANGIYGKNAGTQRWAMFLGDGSSEAGSNSGSNFSIVRCNDAGAVIDTPLQISRSDGRLTLPQDPYQPFHAVTMQYADLKLAKAGGQMTGGLGIGAAPGSLPGLGNANTGIDLNTSAYALISRAGTPLFLNSNIDSNIVQFNRGGGTVGSISVTSTTTSYNTSSDDRLKDGFETFDASRIVDETNVFSFRWKATGERSYGVSAQQANEVYPAAVSYDKANDWWGIDYSKYIPIVLQELKVLRLRVAELEGRLSAKPA